jgi:DtxR family Mn-dependent transcriptional regulator
MNLSHTEENYLKAIYKIAEREERGAGTNAVANAMQTTAASVTDMLKRLSEKELIHYEKYKGVLLSEAGERLAKSLIRRHRLWEVFLVEKLAYSWDAVHDIAEQLEHVDAPELIERLDQFLGRPKYDPHGDPIPDAKGNFLVRKQVLISDLQIGETGIIVGVQEHSTIFLQHLQRLGLVLGVWINVVEVFDFDKSMRLQCDKADFLAISAMVSQNVFVEKT